jgi:P-type Ca2+ transporter type 2C
VTPEDTPLQVKLGRVADLIVKLGTFAALALFLALFIKFLVQLRSSTLTPSEKGQQFVQILIVSVIILVIAVPEGLPLAVTLSLAYATIRMLRDRNLVRVLQACETMGNATTVCSDKTGTLTQNSMQVVAGTIGVASKFDIVNEDVSTPMGTSAPVATSRFFAELPTEMGELFLEGAVANSTVFEQLNEDQREFVGSRTEAALLQICRDQLGLDDLSSARHNLDIVQEFPFNADRKFMAVVVEKWKDGRRFYRLYVKGASEVLLERCTRFVDLNGGVTIYTMGEDARISIARTISDYAAKSFRTLGLLYRDFDLPRRTSDALHDNSIQLEDIFGDMIWIGVVAMRDQLRPGVIDAVKDCQRAGVKVRMVTGDNVATARAVAKECGILDEGGVVLEGPEFRKLSSAELNQQVPKLQILARSSPDDKRRLVQHLKSMGEIVAVTGDGTNDGPALRTADVGFSMGRAGTEVAKEASSIILMDDDFASIVMAILWGRAVNDAVKKFLQVSQNITVADIVSIDDYG